MTNLIPDMFLHVDSFKAKQTLFLDCNCFLIASTVSVYSLQEMMLLMLADGSTTLVRNASYDCCWSRFDNGFHGICAHTNPNMRK